MLYPLADIAPDLDVPGLGSVAALRDARRQPRHRAAVSTTGDAKPRRTVPRRRGRDAAAALHRRRRPDRRGQDQPREAARRTLSRRSWCSSRTRRIPFLERFYRNQKSGALPAQLFFLFQRAQQLGTLKQQDLFAPRRVADYLFEKDRLFAGLTLDAAEMALYEQVASRLAWIRRSRTWWSTCRRRWKRCWQRIAKRGIAYENGIDAAYLTRLNDAYARFFHEFDKAPLLIVNAANIDPVQNQADYDELVGAIRRMKKGRMYYNPLRHSTI